MCSHLTNKFLNIKTIFFCLSLLGYTHTCAQLEAGKWVFGNSGGLDFCHGTVVPFEGTAIKTSEGCASISDSNGNLLFYTDGITVWNRLNEPMPDGTGLKGHASSTQSAIIVPFPGNRSMYYIFTMDSEANKAGFCCSVVDMTKQNGLGNVIFKNRQIKEHCTEKLLAVTHANGKDIWVLVQDNGSDAFYAYLITAEGFKNEPVVSFSGFKYKSSIYNTIGYMKASADRKKLAVAINGENLVQIFDFDNSTGLITSPVSVRFNGDSNPYGIEFSPDNKLLYVGVVKNGCIYQLNLLAGNEASIQKSLLLIGRAKNKTKLGALQLAIDGKIYIAEYLSGFLSSIENPNVQGKDCNYKQESVKLSNTAQCMFGLPTFYRELVKPINFVSDPVFRPGNLQSGVHYRLENVYFDFDKAKLRPESTTELTQLSDYLKQHDSLHIIITGHTDSLGGVPYNLRLSQARAREIGLFLSKNGIPLQRIQCIGKGSSDPLGSNTTDEGRQRNRRVEFILYPKSNKNNHKYTNK